MTAVLGRGSMKEFNFLNVASEHRLWICLSTRKWFTYCWEVISSKNSQLTRVDHWGTQFVNFLSFGPGTDRWGMDSNLQRLTGRETCTKMNFGQWHSSISATPRLPMISFQWRCTDWCNPLVPLRGCRSHSPRYVIQIGTSTPTL